MSRDKFMQFLRFVRFDKKTERSKRLRTDKFAVISEKWNQFMRNSQRCYKSYGDIPTDKQLFTTRARCKFTQCMPNKPHKFGMKFWLAGDVQSKYVINVETRTSTPFREIQNNLAPSPIRDGETVGPKRGTTLGSQRSSVLRGEEVTGDTPLRYWPVGDGFGVAGLLAAAVGFAAAATLCGLVRSQLLGRNMAAEPVAYTEQDVSLYNGSEKLDQNASDEENELISSNSGSIIAKCAICLLIERDQNKLQI
uniref:PiggyBac transposable element-derived protein domain-containing protein n=1 Tax=Glossina austeni TaxID=7395 RepID=A0A1A9UFB6_GLOAU